MGFTFVKIFMIIPQGSGLMCCERSLLPMDRPPVTHPLTFAPASGSYSTHVSLRSKWTTHARM